jgi:tetratricopeptide (TPR) repeat protein
MYCTYCEKLVSEKMAVRRQFCPYCGRKLHWFGIPEVDLSTPIMQAILKRKNFLVRQKLVGLKSHYFKQKDVDIAYVEIMDSLDVNPNNINARFQLGLYFYEKKRFDQAKKEFFKVLAKKEIQKEMYKNVLFNLANIAVEQEDYQLGIDYCDKILMLEDKNINALYNKAVGYYYLGDLSSSLTVFNKILLLDDENEDVKKAINEITAKLN